MTGKRLALVIATSEYSDPDLKKLNSPSQDGKTLGDILRDINIGRFDEVKVLHDQPSYQIRGQIEEFFSDRIKDDLLLLYFSCHGIKDDAGELHFATSDTYRKKLHSTAVSAEWVNKLMKSSRSKRQVLLLDCCYSGAFAKGMVAKGDREIHTREHFDGHGRIILTASDSMQYSFEGDELKLGAAAAECSVFTQVIVQGLKTGEADLNKDGHISLDELYEYTFEKVVKKTPLQKPGKWALGVEGDIIIANSTKTQLTAFLKPNVLWVDDNQDKKEGIRRKFRDVQFDLANSSTEAYSYLNAKDYVLIISDMKRSTPGSGLRLIRGIKRYIVSPPPVFIFASEKGIKYFNERATKEEASFVSFITSSAGDLAGKISEVIKKSHYVPSIGNESNVKKETKEEPSIHRITRYTSDGKPLINKETYPQT
jgi:CheY-like chemotaxis protein